MSGCIEEQNYRLLHISNRFTLNVHFHALALDGVYPDDAYGKIRFHRIKAPTAGELAILDSWCLKSEAAPMSSNAVAPEPEVTESVSTSPDAPSEASNIDWLVGQVVAELNMAPSEIDIQQPFTCYGLASVEGVALFGKLEAWLGRSVPLSLIWDCPTIGAVSAYLCRGSD